MSRVFLGILGFVLISLPSLGAQIYETNDLYEVKAKAFQVGTKFGGSSQVLVVFDLDNTLLKHSQEIGSDQWFRWQEEAVLNKQQMVGKVAQNFSGLLDVQGLLFRISPMKPTQEDAPEIVQELKAKGFSLLALTSRGLEFRDATFKHMRNGYQFSKLGYSSQNSHNFLPYDPNDLTSIGIHQALDPQRRKDLKLDKAPRPVNFSDGVFFGAGQHKGVMMLSILAKVPSLKPKAIVFVDDAQKHVDRMAQALELTAIELHGYRYTREDQRVEDFERPNSPEKSQSIFDWDSLKTTLKSIFGEQALPANEQ